MNVIRCHAGGFRPTLRSGRLACLTILLAAGIAALLPGTGTARTLPVPTEYPRIQPAIDASASGDTIRVSAGTYPGGIDLGTKELVIIGDGAPLIYLEDITKDGIRIAGSQTDATRISGFHFWACMNAIEIIGSSPTIENCEIDSPGYNGILCTNSSATIRGCPVLRGGEGSAVFLQNSPVRIENCIVEGYPMLHGIELTEESNAVVIGCTIRGIGGFWGGGIVCDNSSPLIERCVITGNRSRASGGGLYFAGFSNPVIRNCVISRNGASDWGGGIYFSAGTLTVDHTILWGNCGPGQGKDLTSGPGATVIFTCSDVDSSGFAAYGEVLYDDATVHGDPLFCGMGPCTGGSTAAGDFTLASGSPALTGPCGQIGPLGVGCALSPVSPRTWGGIRQLFR